MNPVTLTYRADLAHSIIDDLRENECTIHRASNGDGFWWMLWFYVARETDGVPEMFAVPVIPGGSYLENGPGGRTWGLVQTAPETWQVSPSINVLDTRDVHPGPHPTLGSVWHQTPAVIGVPAGERWIP